MGFPTTEKHESDLGWDLSRSPVNFLGGIFDCFFPGGSRCQNGAVKPGWGIDKERAKGPVDDSGLREVLALSRVDGSWDRWRQLELGRGATTSVAWRV